MTERTSRRRALLWYWRSCIGLSVWYTVARFRERETRNEMLGTWINELRVGCRTLFRHPRQNAAPVLVLGLGIGLSALALSLLRQTLLAPYPFPDADELHTLWATQRELNRPRVSMSLAEIEDYRRESSLLSDIGLIRPGFEATLSGSQGRQALNLAFVNSGYFRTLGVPPALGRYFTRDEDIGIGAHPYAVISHQFWRTRLPDVLDPIGVELEISNTRFNVVGVAPETFFGPETVTAPVDVWVPTTMSPPFLGNNIYDNRAERVFWTVFRARSPSDLERVRLEAAPVTARLAAEYPTDHDGWGVRSVPLREFVDGTTRKSAIRLVVIAAVMVLLVACVNAASLRLIAAKQRVGEVSIRRALGASRGIVVRQHLVESLLLSGLAGVLGIGLAAALVRLLEGNVALPLPAHAQLGLDATSILLSVALVAGTGLLVGLVPALAATGRRGMPLSGMLDRVHGTRSGVGRVTRRWVLGAEVAVTVILLQVTLATLEGFRQITQTSMGFETTPLLTARLDLQDGRPSPTDSVALRAYNRSRWERRWQFAEQFRTRAPGLPGVESAAIWAPSVLGQASWHARVIRGDLDPNDASNIAIAQRHSITPGGLATAGIPIIAGRDLNDSDGTDSIPGVIVDRVFAENFWPDESALGQIFYTFGGNGSARVVGVSARARHRGRLDPESDIIGDLFFPYRFWPTTTASIIVRGPADTGTQLAAVRELVAQIDPSIGIYDANLMERRLERQESVVRLPALVMTLFGLIAVVLAGTGILAVVNHTLQTREREIGLRRALGLDGLALFATLLGDAAKPVLVGALLGAVGGAFLGSRFLTVTTVGGTTIGVPWVAGAGALVGTIVIAAAAGSLPVIRARRASPAQLLRDV